MAITPGNPITVDSGNVLAFDDRVSYEIETIGGLKSWLFGSEFLVMKFSGNGFVWVQTRQMMNFVARLAPMLKSIKKLLY